MLFSHTLMDGCYLMEVINNFVNSKLFLLHFVLCEVENCFRMPRLTGSFILISRRSFATRNCYVSACESMYLEFVEFPLGRLALLTPFLSSLCLSLSPSFSSLWQNRGKPYVPLSESKLSQVAPTCNCVAQFHSVLQRVDPSRIVAGCTERSMPRACLT